MTEEEAAQWASFDQTLLENRRGRELWELAPEYPNLTFAYRDGDPWADIFGAFRDSPYFDEWQEAIRAYRREREAEEAESDRLVKAA